MSQPSLSERLGIAGTGAIASGLARLAAPLGEVVVWARSPESAAREALELARWDPLPEAALPWERVAELASAQGIGEADVVWDLACGMRGAVRSSAEAPSA